MYYRLDNMNTYDRNVEKYIHPENISMSRVIVPERGIRNNLTLTQIIT